MVVVTMQKVLVHDSLVVLVSPLVVLQVPLDLVFIHPPHLRDLMIGTLVWHRILKVALVDAESATHRGQKLPDRHLIARLLKCLALCCAR
eukprot:Skav219139  [mRNA]  locus=scaffold1574:680160:681218:- [translate_table: standard]